MSRTNSRFKRRAQVRPPVSTANVRKLKPSKVNGRGHKKKTGSVYARTQQMVPNGTI